jgi:hypothetical protein
MGQNNDEDDDDDRSLPLGSLHFPHSLIIILHFAVTLASSCCRGQSINFFSFKKFLQLHILASRQENKSFSADDHYCDYTDLLRMI